MMNTISHDFTRDLEEGEGVLIENMPRDPEDYNYKHCKSGRGVEIDRLSMLPDDILLPILSSLPMKEATRGSVLSKRWKHLWRHHPVLNFKDDMAMRRMGEGHQPFEEEKSRFVAHVDHILKEHVGFAIDDLTVVFDLDINYKSHIDQWVTNALEKHVKRIDLNFETAGVYWKEFEWVNNVFKVPDRIRYTLPHTQSHMLASLTSLRLGNVNVSSEDVLVFFQSCPLLVALRVSKSDILTTIRSSGVSLVLERLEITFCPNIETVDICAPKLLSLKYDGKPIKLRITMASCLSEVHIGGQGSVPIAPTYDSLTEYFSKIKYLSLKMSLHNELNLEASRAPALTSLKHLRLHVVSDPTETLLGWISLIGACPVLEKLTIEMLVSNVKLRSQRQVVEGSERPLPLPLRCLKTFELLGYVGRKLDLELADYVLENAISVEQVIVDFRSWRLLGSIRGALRRLNLLESKLRKGVKLILKETYPHSDTKKFTLAKSSSSNGL